jgi:NADPH-dependent glutamate synthase beta subunit-like oxidoreductase
MSEPIYKASLPDTAYWTGRIPCQMACPVLTDCGRYVQLISEGRFEEAYLTARAPNPTASICGRICAAPCEDKCRRGLFDAPVSIRALKRFVTERFGVESRQPGTLQGLLEGTSEPGNKWLWHLSNFSPERRNAGRGRKVAVIGAGPAGLGCAHDLALMGYSVTIFEATQRGGGMAYHGIPEFRLSRSLLDKEIDFIAGLGVEIKYQTPLSADFGIQELKAQGFEAIFLGIGLQQGRGLNCPGSDLDGVIRAIEFLININNGYRVPRANKVLVLGGGLVAFDAARMALRAMSAEQAQDEHGGSLQTALDAARIAARAGADVTLACLESYDEMPVTRTEQGREEFEDTRREGIRFLHQRGVAALSGSGGRVQSANLIGVSRTYDEQGRFAPIFDESIHETVEADLVLLAIGQQADLSCFRPEDGLQFSQQGTIKIDPETLATTAPGVFAGGDVAYGPRNLIDGVGDGKRAARSIDDYLRQGRRTIGFNFRFEKVPTRRFERVEDYDQTERAAPPTSDLGRRSGISEVEYSYDEQQAMQQAERCLACHIQTIYDPQKCVLCNRCVDICPTNCLKLVPYEQVQVDYPDMAPLFAQAGVDGNEPLSVMLKDDERCIRCGLCAIRCPTDAMTMEVLYYEQR